MEQLIIIGGGPAGYTSAIYAARASLLPVQIASYQVGGQLMWTTLVENYPGFKDGVMGPTLMDDMRSQAEKLGARVINKDVTKVDFSGKIKRVWVEEELFEAKTIIVATGAKGRMLGLGEEQWLGRGVSTCAVCDAAFFRGKKVAVVGGGDAAMEDTLALAKVASEVSVIHRRDSFRASKVMQERVLGDKKIRVLWNTQVVEVDGGEKLEKIRLKNVDDGKKREMEIDGLFLAVGHIPSTDIFVGQLGLDELGYLITNMTKSDLTNNKDLWLHNYPTGTTVEGVFGAGDVTDFRYRQAVTAAAMGCMAALDVEKYLSHNI